MNEDFKINDNIKIPDELSERIDNTIEGLKKPTHYIRNTLSTAAAVIIAFFIAINVSIGFATYASNLPGMKLVVEWMKLDKGIENAQKHGFEKLKNIAVEENGYLLRLEDIFFDSDRIEMSAILVYDEDLLEQDIETDTKTFERIIKKDSNINDPEPFREGSYTEFMVNIKGFEGSMITYGSGTMNEGYIAKQVQSNFRDNMLEKYLNENKDYLEVEVKIYKGRDNIIHVFDNIQIPFDREKIPKPTFIQLDKEVETQYGNILFNELKISPTRMYLDFDFEMKEGYFFSGFEKIWLEDKKGNRYSEEGLSFTSAGTMNTGYKYYCIPSIYYDTVDELMIYIDGMRIGSEEGREFTLSLNGEYPKKVDYMGEEILIKEVEWYKSKVLKVTADFPPQSILRIQGFDIMGCGAKSWSSPGNEYKDRYESIMDFEIEKHDEYEAEFSYPGYYVPIERTIEIQIK